ncbi:hypothetical protein FB639_000635 [Coemansia asiatica]|nr:hypothetical protein FB639_000635 [Coemansia asiatica]
MSVFTGGAFGGRMLSSDCDVFEHNAWDHVEPDADHYQYAEQQIRLHQEHPVPEEDREFSELFSWTDDRYSADKVASSEIQNAEYEETKKSSESSDSEFYDVSPNTKFCIMEVGCGAGNAVFPLLADIRDPRLFVYACDYSKTAVDVVKANDAYDENRCKAFVWDLSSTELPEGVEPASVDIMLMVFVFSALHPDQWDQAVENAYRLLKPGGILLFRDYGRNDLTQLRFKKSRLLDNNFYIRGDGTRVYFFTNEQLQTIFCKKFVVEQNAIDRRLLVNRKRELKMYRVWLQAKFRKPFA